MSTKKVTDPKKFKVVLMPNLINFTIKIIDVTVRRMPSPPMAVHNSDLKEYTLHLYTGTLSIQTPDYYHKFPSDLESPSNRKPHSLLINYSGKTDN